MSERDRPRDVSSYSRTSILAAAIVSIAVALLLAWAAAGFGSFYETLFRVGPTVAGGGVGADWVAGNEIWALNALVTLTHAADAVMGLFILVMVFVHWAAFRRLAARMRGEPAERRPEADGDDVATDGGSVAADANTDRDADANTDRDADGNADRDADGNADRDADGRTDRDADGRTDRDADGHTDGRAVADAGGGSE